MIIKKIRIKNYRLLKDVSLSLDEKSTVVVGRNNTGKTSLAEIFRSFVDEKSSKIRYEDFNLLALLEFKSAVDAKNGGLDENEVRKLTPAIELELLLNYHDNQDAYGALGDFILDLNENQFETKVLIKYQLSDGKIQKFYEDLNSNDDTIFYKELKVRIKKYFEICLYAIDPADENNIVKQDFSKIKKILFADFINAQRGLDDETHNEKDVLGKSLASIFESASRDNASDDFKITSQAINDTVSELQLKVDEDFQTKVSQLLPTLAIFGYPGLGDSNLKTLTELNVKSLLASNTHVYYQKNAHFTLPETYNGLGFRNLIYILFKMYEYFRRYQSSDQLPNGHIIFIEEPEAHLHPQMQEVFIRQLDKIVEQFQNLFNDDQKWPVQFIVSTHSSHVANEAEFTKVRYFLSKDGKCTKIKDLGEAFRSAEDQEDREFLQKYLTLAKCDLYFADKAILIEGAAERILWPQIVKKIDVSDSTNLQSKYISVVEVGGAYAHHFYKFLDFLELKALVITDLDCVARKEGDDRRKSYTCSESEYTSNAGLRKWFEELDGSEISLRDILLKTEEQKIKNCRRIAFQVPEEGKTARARSFEDAFILANRSLFNLENEIVETVVEQKAFAEAKEIGNESKANFAIKYAIENTEWNTPKYIKEGLIWLSNDELTNSTAEIQE